MFKSIGNLITKPFVAVKKAVVGTFMKAIMGLVGILVSLVAIGVVAIVPPTKSGIMISIVATLASILIKDPIPWIDEIIVVMLLIVKIMKFVTINKVVDDQVERAMKKITDKEEENQRPPFQQQPKTTPTIDMSWDKGSDGE